MVLIFTLEIPQITLHSLYLNKLIITGNLLENFHDPSIFSKVFQEWGIYIYYVVVNVLPGVYRKSLFRYRLNINICICFIENPYMVYRFVLFVQSCIGNYFHHFIM